MSTDQTAPNPIYQPSPGPLDREATPASTRALPDAWICALNGSRPGPVTLTISGLHVTVQTIGRTCDSVVMSDTLAQLRAAVTKARRSRPVSRVIAPGLPPHVATVSWRTPDGDVTLIHPKARLRGWTGRLSSAGAPLAAGLAFCGHRVTSHVTTIGVAGAAAGVVTVAAFTPGALPSTDAPRPRPPAHAERLDMRAKRPTPLTAASATPPPAGTAAPAADSSQAAQPTTADPSPASSAPPAATTTPGTPAATPGQAPGSKSNGNGRGKEHKRKTPTAPSATHRKNRKNPPPAGGHVNRPAHPPRPAASTPA